MVDFQISLLCLPCLSGLCYVRARLLACME